MIFSYFIIQPKLNQQNDRSQRTLFSRGQGNTSFLLSLGCVIWIYICQLGRWLHDIGAWKAFDLRFQAASNELFGVSILECAAKINLKRSDLTKFMLGTHPSNIRPQGRWSFSLSWVVITERDDVLFGWVPLSTSIFLLIFHVTHQINCSFQFSHHPVFS